jgi:hypothetical protein
MRKQTGVALLLLAAIIGCGWLGPARAEDPKLRFGQGVSPEGPINTLNEVFDALRGCWKWPPGDEIQTGMQLTIRISFKRSGEIFGTRLTYQSAWVSGKERALYHETLEQMLLLCSPLPVTESLGHAIAGRMFTFTITDTRKQRKA